MSVQRRKRFKLVRTGTRKYYPYQQDFHNWAMPRQHFASFIEMRLGKSLGVIRVLIEKSNIEGVESRPHPILIVCPMSVIKTWQRELELEGEQYVVLHGKTLDQRVAAAVVEGFDKPCGRTWILINYDSLRATPGLANSAFKWFSVVLDESTIIKNVKSKISTLCERHFRTVEHRVIMSGLPSPEGELDLFQQFKFLYGSFMGYKSYWHYRLGMFELTYEGWKPKKRELCTYCNNEYDKRICCPNCECKGYTPFSGKSLIKQAVHDNAFVLTRFQAGINVKKVRVPRYVKMAEIQRKVYDRIEDEFVAEISPDRVLETDHIIAQLTWLGRVTGGCDAEGTYKWAIKTTELVNLLKGELKDQAIVVGFRYDAEIHAVAARLKHENIACATLTGVDSRETRVEKTEWFMNSTTKSRVILVQIKKVAQYGVDLSACDTMVFYSCTYSGEEMNQFEDRIVAVRKTGCTMMYIYLLAEDTIDEDYFEATRDKIRNAKQLMARIKTNFYKRVSFKTKPKTRTRKDAA